ncbi:MAG: ABC-F family ATP-binding cassette domain-containing protein [Myxococcota bacterium]|nr:ABC-F family ATP-binding cassette domain-containing protein [Myxococcota bacterium]
MLLRLEGVSRSFPMRTLFAGVDLTINAGDRVGIVGANGAGKTSLLRLAAGIDTPDAGRVVLPKQARRGFLQQEIDPGRGHSVREEAATALAHLDVLEQEMADLQHEMERVGQAGRDVPADLADRWDRAQSAFSLAGGFEREARIERVLAGLGIDSEAAGRPLSAFSGGWLMRVELAKLLLAGPDVLLLDEPTNHLDLPSIEWFEETLAGFRGGVILVSHDRAFLRRHVNRVAELDGGRFWLCTGGWDRYLEQKALRREQLEAAKRQQDRSVAETERFIERFRYKASKAKQVQSRVKALEKLDRVELPEESRARMRLRLPEPVRAGEVVLRLEDVHKSYGETRVYSGVGLEVRRGERLALVGPNGAGKSTLLRLVAGTLSPDAGERTVGHKVSVGFYAQHQIEVLDASATVMEELARTAQTDDVPRLRGHLGAFLFSGDDVDKRVSVLSGGEKARLALAKLLLRPVNFLVFDEPTNHLDVGAREVLEEALSGYAGTLLFISHDRDFIDALATRVIDVRAGTLESHLGNYSDFRRRRGAAGADGVSAVSAERPPGAAKRERMEARERERVETRERARERRQLERLEGEIEALEEELASLDQRLADPEVWRDGEATREIETRRAEVRVLLDGHYAEWEALGDRSDA